MSFMTLRGSTHNAMRGGKSTLKLIFDEAWAFISGIWAQIPRFFQIILIVALGMALLGIVLSLVRAIFANSKEWKQAPNSNLMLGYFCGTGNARRRKMFHEARALLYDRKWLWLSFARLAYCVGNCTANSKFILALCSMVYVPIMLLGLIEMSIRMLLGFIIFSCLNLLFMALLAVSGLAARLLIPVFRLIDRSLRVEQHCPSTSCYATFRLPGFVCPYCGRVHSDLVPGRCGLLFARCSCGHFIPCSSLTHRSKLTAVCPKCSTSLAASNAKQFFIQIVGGNAAGKTAFSAAFQHQYFIMSKGDNQIRVHGTPSDNCQALENYYRNGTTAGSERNEIISYNYTHEVQGTATHSLIFYDIPDKVLAGNEYVKSPLNFGYTDGIIMIIDPLSVVSFREKCISRGEVSRNIRYSEEGCESVIVDFINKFSEIVGRSAGRMSDIPVAVLISKSDIKSVKGKIGLPSIRAQYRMSPESYGNDWLVARDEICRSFLCDIGLVNVVNNIEGVFTEVNYFPVSAIGHAPESGIAFEPFGVIEPVAWIARKRQSALYQYMKNVLTKLNRGSHEG